MNKVVSKVNGETFEVILEQKRANAFVLIMLAILSVLSGLVPVAMLLFVGIGVGTLVGSFLFLLCGYFFLRLFLWNRQGRELIRLRPGAISQVIDYGWFQDEDSITSKGVSIRIYDENESRRKEDENVLDDGLKPEPKQGFIRFMYKGDVVMTIRTELKQPELRNIVDELESRLA